MKAKENNTQDTDRQSVAASIVQKEELSVVSHPAHSSGGITQGKMQSFQEMANNSVQVKQAKALQQQADNSPQVKQLKAVNPMDSNAVMQLKLQKGVFNVAGEDHGESDERRDKEFLFSIFAVMSPHYWKEDEFKLERENGSSRLGDRAVLRAGHAVQLVYDYHDDYTCNLKQLLKEMFKDKPTVSFEELVGDMRIMAQRRDHFLHVAVYELQREESEEHNNKWVNLRELLSDLTEMQLDVEAIEEANSYADLRDQAETMHEANASFTERVANAFNFYNITKQDGITESLSAKRDDYMHKSAEMAQEQGKTGVWKIGQEHVEGIRQKGLENHYNLVSQEEFNQEYEEDKLEGEEEQRRIRKKYGYEDDDDDL